MTRDLQKSVSWDSTPTPNATQDWEKFQTLYDEHLETIHERVIAESEQKDVFVFLLDKIPPRLVPVICLLWNQRMMAYFRKDPDFSENTLPCDLAVMSEDSISKFNEGCADAQVLFDQLKKIRTFSLDAPILLEGPDRNG